MRFLTLPFAVVSAVAALLVSSATPAAGLFITPAPTYGGGDLFSVTTADFNGDGFLDLAAADFGNDYVRIWRGVGDGTFVIAGYYWTGHMPKGVVAADFNGDGHLDLAVTNAFGNTVSVLLGVGDSTFGASTDYTTGSSPAFGVVAADFNGDGRLDLAVPNSGGNSVSILTGNGDGTFNAKTDWAMGINPMCVLAADFNGDGKIDIATGGAGDNKITLRLGNGDGTFQNATTYATGNAPRFLSFADLNGDGFGDLVVTNVTDNTVSVLLGNGDGTFQAQAIYATGTAPSVLVIADFNGDGKLDLAVNSHGGASVSLLLGNGDGTFQAKDDYAVTPYNYGMTTGRFNADAKLDIAVVSSMGGGVSILIAQGPPVLSSVGVSGTSTTATTLAATSDEAATGYWVVVARNAAAPTSAQVKAAATYSGVTIAASGNASMTANTAKNFSVTGLIAGTNYDLYFAAEDGTSDISGVKKVQFATSAAGDSSPPAYQSAALNAGLTVATLIFDEALVNNLADLTALKVAVTFASDGTTFNALAVGDAVALSGSTLIVTFGNALSGTTNKVKVAANSLKDATGNVLASAVTTAALDATDTTPSAFSFTATTGAALSAATESSTITVTGINAAANISIIGGQYAVSTDNGATWGAYTAAAGTVNLNDRVKVKLTSSSSYSTAMTATLTIGGVSAAFSVTTQAAPAPVYDPGSYVPPAPTVINAPNAVNTTLTGTTPVNAELGSTLTIPAGANVSGVAITLAAPVAGVSAQPVTLNIGGNTLTVTPSAANVVVTLKTVTVNGVPTLVLAVSSGAVTVAAAAGQTLLTVSNSGMVVTAGSGGGAVAFDASGTAALGVTSGSVLLSANAFADANSFAAIKDGKLYAGEVAVLDGAGKVARVRLGSLNGGGKWVGDALKPTTAAGLSVMAAVPDLKGKVARISEKDDFTAVLAAAVGKGITALGQNADGVLVLDFPGGKLQALPWGEITVDTSRPDGITLTALNRAEVAKGGVVTRFAPAVGDFAAFAASLAKMDKNAYLAVLEDGMVHMRLNGATYPLQPAWTVEQDKNGLAGLSTDDQGLFVYRDGAGNRQTLYPTFADLPRLIAAFKALDANVAATGNGDGTVSAKYLGKTYTLTPDYVLVAVPAAHAKDAYWLDGGKVFVKNSDGKTAQGFAVK